MITLQQVYPYDPLYLAICGVTLHLHWHKWLFTTNGGLSLRDGALLPHEVPRSGVPVVCIVPPGYAMTDGPLTNWHMWAAPIHDPAAAANYSFFSVNQW